MGSYVRSNSNLASGVKVPSKELSMYLGSTKKRRLSNREFLTVIVKLGAYCYALDD